ncbi:MAG: hypothetical protein A2599_00305 [Candidatus Staskawiczbacteria bacterium RIFOXYD1_FULL_39_28]|uniref:Uncharacterized protein n=1 Tax=Candidatus Staskawiczbacteria bacterium RIFOXYC1_FULL_38_18 TaxID=1802229 RepID=A0A1G2JDQ1_9BACT|nr:MAG: hypothetical protein A2401_03020 [Candidatus Staskawiczbacteria bacterium RIFOXYC1_FULL_38_18]OGZ90380.1 MAG: hypothetical protein A2599_00305 [Candidatus Staskawiczbacteria bacterium RIFOXYD1_FULL_39_28]
MNFKEFIAKLQNLSDTNKKIVLWTIVAILGLIMAYFWINSAINKISQFKAPNLPSFDISETIK